MCLAVPLRLIEINGNDAIGEAMGLQRAVRVDFIPDPKIGDYVMVHAGFAMQKVEEKDAEETYALMAEMRGAPRTVDKL